MLKLFQYHIFNSLLGFTLVYKKKYRSGLKILKVSDTNLRPKRKVVLRQWSLIEVSITITVTMTDIKDTHELPTLYG